MMIGNRIERAKMSCHKGFLSLLLCVLSSLSLFTSCSSIDEDLSDCGNEYEMEYELQLITNIETELQTQLTTQAEMRVADALREHLANIFTAFARDIDLSFYDTGKEANLLHYESQLMNDNEKSYQLFLPMQKYRHLALANLQGNSWVGVTGREQSNTLALEQKQGETIESHETGIFSARADMDVLEGVDQTFHVKLLMANCATALVIENPEGVEVKDIQVYATGFATGFQVNTNTYTFVGDSPLVHAQPVDTGIDNMLCFCAVNFPSRDQAEGDEPLWEYRVYVTLADGTVTETILKISEPLCAGEFKLVVGQLDRDGSVRTDNSEVATSVTLDWKSGLEIEY